MSDPAAVNVSLGERIDTLEMRVAYQDETIETLNQALTAQWEQIDALKREIARLVIGSPRRSPTSRRRRALNRLRRIIKDEVIQDLILRSAPRSQVYAGYACYGARLEG